MYVYYGDLDATGHHRGCQSPAWRLQLEHVDLLARQLSDRLPPGAAMYVTADHGMVDVPGHLRYDADAEPDLRAGVDLLGGEGRARHVYTVPGAAADVLAAWREILGEDFWVYPRDEAVAAGWFGPVADAVLPRIGDVLAAARGAGAVVASAAEPAESALVGMHGSMTPAEQLIPLLTVPA